MLIRVVIFVILLYLLFKIIKSLLSKKSVKMNANEFKAAPVHGEDLVEDISCHTYIPVSQAYKKEIAGKNHYFCSKECCENYILEKSKKKQ